MSPTLKFFGYSLSSLGIVFLLFFLIYSRPSPTHPGPTGETRWLISSSPESGSQPERGFSSPVGETAGGEVEWEGCENRAGRIHCEKGEDHVLTFQEATDRCRDFSDNGTGGWRLPSLAETEPMASLFRQMDPGRFLIWTGDPVIRHPGLQWALDIRTGVPYPEEKTSSLLNRCVRPVDSSLPAS